MVFYMKALRPAKNYIHSFYAWRVQKHENVSVMYGKKKVRAKVGDWICTDKKGDSYIVRNSYFKKYCFPE